MIKLQIFFAAFAALFVSSCGDRERRQIWSFSYQQANSYNASVPSVFFVQQSPCCQTYSYCCPYTQQSGGYQQTSYPSSSWYQQQQLGYPNTQPLVQQLQGPAITCDQITMNPNVQDCIPTKTGLMFLSLQNATWSGAQTACKAINPASNLATIRNTDDYQAMLTLSSVSYVSDAWIGLSTANQTSYQSPSGQAPNFQWVEDGSVLANNYSQWLPGFPQVGPPSCVYAALVAYPDTINTPPVGALVVDGGWGNGDCSMQANPLCYLRYSAMLQNVG